MTFFTLVFMACAPVASIPVSGEECNANFIPKQFATFNECQEAGIRGSILAAQMPDVKSFQYRCIGWTQT